MVSGHSRKDFVLASVVRLHEVVGGAVEARLDGGKVAGLGAVGVEGVSSHHFSTQDTSGDAADIPFA